MIAKYRNTKNKKYHYFDTKYQNDDIFLCKKRTGTFLAGVKKRTGTFLTDVKKRTDTKLPNYPIDTFLTILTKYVIIQNRLPRGQKKRFYFNVLKNGKKQIIKRDK